MKIFIWQEVDKATSECHEQGGVVVVAETEERARALANGEHEDTGKCQIGEDEAPTRVYDLGNEEEILCIFKNTGCC